MIRVWCDICEKGIKQAKPRSEEIINGRKVVTLFVMPDHLHIASRRKDKQ